MLKFIYSFYESGHSELLVDCENNAKLRLAAYQNWFGNAIAIHRPEVAPFYQVDVVVFGPCENFPCYRYITQGMSDYPMNTSSDLTTGTPDRVELMLYSKQGPAGSNGATSRGSEQWQIRLLRALASQPFASNSCLKAGDTCLPVFPDGEPILQESHMPNCFFYPPVHESPSVKSGIELTESHCQLLIVDFLSNVEMAYKQENGTEALFDLFDANNHFPVIERQSYL
jgi:hypothetical protein